MSEKRLTYVDGQCGYYGSPNMENTYSLGSLFDLYLLEAYKKFPNCEDKRWLSEYARGKAINEAIQKLGKHEDIEEELGIDLVTLFKALKDGIYIKEYNHGLMYGLIVPHLVHECGQYYFKHYGDFGSEEFSFDEYGETWALTKEELE